MRFLLCRLLSPPSLALDDHLTSRYRRLPHVSTTGIRLRLAIDRFTPRYRLPLRASPSPTALRLA